MNISKTDKTTKYVLTACAIILILVVGYYVYVTMYIEIEQYEDEIIQLGPPGVTNVVPVFGIVLIGAFLCCIIMKYKNSVKAKP